MLQLLNYYQLITGSFLINKNKFSYSVADLKTDEDWADFNSDTNLDDVVVVIVR